MFGGTKRTQGEDQAPRWNALLEIIQKENPEIVSLLEGSVMIIR
jgi:hypothetical protein